MIEVAVHVGFKTQTVRRKLLKQHNVYYLAAAAHIKLAGGAANDLYIVNLLSGNACHLATSLIILASCSFAVNDYLTAAAAAKASATITASLTRTSKASSTASRRAANPRYTIQHILCGNRVEFSEIARRIDHGRILAHVILCARYLRGGEQEGYSCEATR